MLNLLNRSYSKAEKLIVNIRKRENELWEDHLSYVHTLGELDPETIELRHKWNTIHEIMKESGVKTVAQIRVDNQETIK